MTANFVINTNVNLNRSTIGANLKRLYCILNSNVKTFIIGLHSNAKTFILGERVQGIARNKQTITAVLLLYLRMNITTVE